MQKEKQSSAKMIQDLKLSSEQENEAWAAKVEQLRKYHHQDME